MNNIYFFVLPRNYSSVSYKMPNFRLHISLPYSRYSLRCTKVFCSSFLELKETNLCPPSHANVTGLVYKISFFFTKKYINNTLLCRCNNTYIEFTWH